MTIPINVVPFKRLRTNLKIFINERFFYFFEAKLSQSIKYLKKSPCLCGNGTLIHQKWGTNNSYLQLKM